MVCYQSCICLKNILSKFESTKQTRRLSVPYFVQLSWKILCKRSKHKHSSTRGHIYDPRRKRKSSKWPEQISRLIRSQAVAGWANIGTLYSLASHCWALTTVVTLRRYYKYDFFPPSAGITLPDIPERVSGPVSTIEDTRVPRIPLARGLITQTFIDGWCRILNSCVHNDAQFLYNILTDTVNICKHTLVLFTNTSLRMW